MNEDKFNKLSAHAGVRGVFWCRLVDGDLMAARQGDCDVATEALCRAVPDGERWMLHRNVPDPTSTTVDGRVGTVAERVTVLRKGDCVLVVTTEIGHPVTKSINRMMERAMR